MPFRVAPRNSGRPSASAVMGVVEGRMIRPCKDQVKLPERLVIWAVEWVDNVDAAEALGLHICAQLLKAQVIMREYKVVGLHHDHLRVLQRYSGALEDGHLKTMRPDLSECINYLPGRCISESTCTRTLNIWTLNIKTLNIKTLNIKTLNIKTLSRASTEDS